MAQNNHPKNAMGFVSVVSLVLLMQADRLVINSGSNWSRVMEELCLDAEGASRCAVVDVTPERPYDWRRRG